MPSPIIQGWLNDQTVDAGKRSRVFNDISSGTANEGQIEAIISNKYGSKYGATPGQQLAKTSFGQNIIGGFNQALGAIQQHGIQGAALDAVGHGAAQVGHAMAARANQPNLPQPSTWQAPGAQFPMPQLPSVKLNLPGVNLDSSKPLESAQSLGQAGLNAAGFVADNTIKPIGDFTNMAVGAPIAAIKGGVAALQNSDFSNPQEYTQLSDKAKQAQGAAMTESTPVGTNPFKADSSGNLDLGASEKNIAGTALKGLAGGINTASLFSPELAINLRGQAVAGAESAGGQALQDNKSLPEAALAAAGGGALQGGMGVVGNLAGKLGGAAFGKLSEMINGKSDAIKGVTEGEFVQKLLKKGVPEKDINMMASLTPEGHNLASDYLQTGIDKLKNPLSAPNVFDKAGQEVKDYLAQAQDLKKTLGKDLGAAKIDLGKETVNPSSIKAPIAGDLKTSLNVKMKGNNLDFSASPIADNTVAVNKIKDVWKKLSSQGMNARDLEAVTGQIDEITGLLKSSGYKGSEANTALGGIKAKINGLLSDVSPTFGEANKKYAQFINEYKIIKAANRVPTAAGKETFNPGSMMRRLVGNQDAKGKAGIEAMNTLEKTIGLKAPTNLVEKAHIADMAERTTKTIQGQSLAGGVEKATDVAGEIAKHAGVPRGTIGTLLSAVKHLLPAKAPIEEHAQYLVKMLAGLAAEQGKQVPSNLKELIVNSLKVGTPALLKKAAGG